jgi:transposase-like protein
MKDNMITNFDIKNPNNFTSSLEEIIRDGARKMLQSAIENEVLEFIENNKYQKDEKGHRLIVRNGYLPKRNIQSGIGDISIKQPRVRDKAKNIKFTSTLLPRYMKKCPSLENLIPILYLKGVSTNNFQEALESILGEKAKGLSATNIVRLKNDWELEFKEFSQRDMTDKHYIYLWADGIYFNVRLDNDRPCLLVIVGVTPEGKKELVAIHDGQRESKLSWKEVLQDLKKRGLNKSPELAIGDGALGFWRALEEEFPNTKHQRCWVHKTVNILDKMPKSIHGNAKKLIHEMYLSPSKKEALKVYESFMKLYSDKYEKACLCLSKDKDVLFSFYDFPAIHWLHIRTTNAIESTFSTVRHRTRQTKGCGTRMAILSLVYKLAITAQKRWMKIKGYNLLEKVIKGIKYIDGIEAGENVA